MAASQAVKFPIQLYGLHARYANALYSAAVKSKCGNKPIHLKQQTINTLTTDRRTGGNLKKVETDLAQVKSWLNEKPAFKTYLKNPIVQRSEKKVDMDKISKGMNDTTRGFLMVLAENGRLADLEKVLNTFDRLIDAERGVVKATVTSAEALGKCFNS